MDLIFFGIQGSGKGTQARKLIEEQEYCYFEAGSALRAIQEQDTPLGRTVKECLDKGCLVPSKIILDVVRDFVEHCDAEKPILFDGIPRNQEQKEGFDALMNDYDRAFTCILFELSDAEAFKRIQSRAEKEGRADDMNEETIKSRMAWHYEQTMPVVEQYRAQDLVKTIDADGSVDTVYAELKETLASTPMKI